MSANPFPVESAVGSFLLSFPALFSIVNPVGSALIFDELTAGRSRPERHAMARRIAIYASVILLASLWLGGYVLNFFGISLEALRIAGGLVVAVTAWGLLMQADAPDKRDGTASTTSKPPQANDDIAFFPLTMPLTTGPGTIAVAIALSSQRPDGGAGTLPFFGGLSCAALAVALLVWICNRFADRLTATLGPGGVRILSRLVAFLLLCIGTQIIVTGVIGVAGLIEHGR